MRAIQIDEFGGPDKLLEKNIPIPTPEENEVVVKIEYSGINYMDVYMRNGSYAKSHTYQTPLPMTVGMEGAGTIYALGKNVEGFKLGEQVAYCLSKEAMQNTPQCLHGDSSKFLQRLIVVMLQH